MLIRGQDHRILRLLVGIWSFRFGYANVHGNWTYVESGWIVGLIGLALPLKTRYPFAYIYVWMKGDKKRTTMLNPVNWFTSIRVPKW